MAVGVDVEGGIANHVLVSVHFAKRTDLYQVLKLRDGAVIHIQDVRRRREARRAAGLAS